MGRTVYSYKNGKAEVVSKSGDENLIRYKYVCEKHGEFDVEKRISEASREEKCPKCGKVATRVFLDTNIDQTMYRRDPSSPWYWRNNISPDKYASALNEECDPY